MAKLQSDDLTVEIRFNSFENEWVVYEIRFYWKDEIIINDSILKRTSGYWNRSYGTFLANDYKEDDLIKITRKVLKTNKAECWEPMEPDAKVAIFPSSFFPFVETRYNLFKEIEEMRKEKEDQKNEEDLFTIIIFIDSYNFKDSSAYTGQGISLHLIVKRRDLEKFADDLETEYSNLKIGQ